MDILDTRENLNAMVLKHEQQIKDIAAHLLELRKWGTPMMEFKREKLLQEPVAWLVTYGGLTNIVYTQPTEVVDTHYQPLYATSPQREWVGLTGPEVDAAYKSVSDKEWAIGGLADARVFFCDIEAKLKEKNGG